MGFETNDETHLLPWQVRELKAKVKALSGELAAEKARRERAERQRDGLLDAVAERGGGDINEWRVWYRCQAENAAGSLDYALSGIFGAIAESLEAILRERVADALDVIAEESAERA